jgi:hypothetical protein
MFWNRFVRPIVVFVTLALPLGLFARGEFLDFLGSATVDATQNHRSIAIVRRDHFFRSIELRVSNEQIFFERVVVHFGDGSSQEFPVNGRIFAEAENYVMELPGERRALESVELWYYKEAWGQNPRVTLYGVPRPDGDAESVARAQ